MKTNNVTIIFLYLVSAFLIGGVAYPLYNGGGYKLIPGTSNVMYELARYKDLESLQQEALKLKATAVAQADAFKNIDATKVERIDNAVVSKMDVPRMLNDYDALISKHGLRITSVTPPVKGSVHAKYSSLNSYLLALTVTGTYTQFKSFITSVENSSRLYDIKDLTFSKLESRNERGQLVENSAGLYTFTFNIEAFELK